MKNELLRIVVFLYFAFPVFSASPEPLGEKLDALFNAHSNAVWSVQVVDKNSGKSIYSHTPYRALIPASNEKLVVCAAALLRLGPNYVYETTLSTTGQLSGSTLKGDLIVTGTGDPCLGGRFTNGDITFLLRQWAGILKEKGIQTIGGNIVGVDDAFDDTLLGLNWHPTDLVEWYAAPVSALSLNDACIDIQVLGGSASGRPVTISLNPPTRYVTIQSNVQTVGSAKQERGVVAKREPDSPVIELSGSIRAKGASTVPITIPNPTLYFTTVFKEVLTAEGIAVNGDALDGDDAKLPDRKTWNQLYVHKSPPLIQIVEVCMKRSQNLYAEHILKTLGYVNYGVGSWPTGAMAIKDIFFNDGCQLDGLFFADGSGLSRENRISADAFVQILKVIDQSPLADAFFDALPRAGVDGTLKNRMRGTDAFGKVFAKTGTLNGVRALSGKMIANSGKTYLFSILGNATRQAIRISEIVDDACALIISEG